ncbi:hypothetical protein [Phenylobacterium sp.]|jgi:hypothetical protein|nr:hypothetical protein [Phenylobacterium sp.]HEX3365341.1 hypothetical protein [Phenylobacterium sp.]
MTHGFQQQDSGLNFSFPKSAPTPQHGGKTDSKPVQPRKPPRSFEPRPGH